LTDARATIPHRRYDEFLSWIDSQFESQLADLARQPIGYEELTGVIDSPSITLEGELRWIAARVKKQARTINLFRAAATEIETAIFKNHFNDAIKALQVIELALGVTLWSVQLRIAVEQLASGLESQKRYTASVRNVYKRGLLGFVAYHTSVRNEDKTTYSKFIDDIKARIERHQYYTPPLHRYLRYRLAAQLPETEETLADVLRVEQSHSLIDIYETFVAVLQQITRRDELAHLHQTVIELTGRLSDIDDYRFQKIGVVLSGTDPRPDLTVRSTFASDALLAGNARLALLRSRRLLSTAQKIDVWQMICAGFARAHSPQDHLANCAPLAISLD
jgi:hypothetical protein